MDQLREKLHNFIDEMDETQIRIVWGFVKRLFRLPD